MIRSSTVVFGVVVSATLACMPAPARADEPIPSERRLPPNVLQFFRVRDALALFDRLRESLVGRMVSDPAVWDRASAATKTDLRKDFDELANTQWIKPFDEEVGMPLGKFLRKFGGELTFAVTYSPTDEFETVILANLGGHAGAVPEHRDLIAEWLIQGKFEYVEETIRDTPSTLVVAAKGPFRPVRKVRAGFFVKDSWLVAATSEKLLDAVLLRWDGQHAETLDTDPEFHEIQQ